MRHSYQYAAAAAVLAGSLLAPALANEPAPEVVNLPQPKSYQRILTVNGQEVDASALPYAQGLPMRLIAEADHGNALWLEEENESIFYLQGAQIRVNYGENTVSVGDTVLEGITAQVVDGVTFLPEAVLAAVEGYTVDQNLALDVDRVDIITPNNAPVVKLGYELMEISNANANRTGLDLLEYYGINPESFTEAAAFFPMNISPDTLLVGRLADGSEEEVKAGLEAYRQQQADTFSWYLSQNLPKVEDAKLVVKDGWLLFVIAEHSDEAVTAFEAWVAAQNS